jgi:uncharacterized protein YbjT (DUF2867 family)
MTNPRILITGGTGQQGGATIRALRQSGREWAIRALVRDPASVRARRLTAEGVEVVRGDLNDDATVRAALADVYGVFSVQSPQEGGPDAEERQGKLLASAAADAGVRHFVYTSAGGAERHSGIPHFESKWRVEQHIRRLGLPATILRPAAFMDNFLVFSFRTIMLSMWKTFMPADRAMQLVAVKDIGRFAARAFNHPDCCIGQSLELAGDSVTRRQVVQSLRHAGLRPAISLRFPTAMHSRLPHEYIVMFKWMSAHGFQADIATLRGMEPNLMNFSGWAADFE